MKAKLLVDSATDISKAEAESLGIGFLPITVMFGEEEYKDGETLSVGEFYDKLATSKELPKTSLINEFKFEEAFNEATKDGSEVVVITLSSKLSGTYNAAVSAAEKFDGKVYVVDSLNACLGERLLCQYAIKLLKEGKSAKEIKESLDKKKDKVRICAVVDTLKYLKMGGRISSTVAFVGGILSVKPIIGVVDGEVKMLGKAVGLKKAITHLNSTIEKEQEIDFDMPFGVLYSGNSDENAKTFKEISKRLWEGKWVGEVPTYQMGCTIGTHIGPGAIGIAFFDKK